MYLYLFWWGGHCCAMHCDLLRSIVLPRIWVNMPIKFFSEAYFSGLRFYDRNEFQRPPIGSTENVRIYTCQYSMKLNVGGILHIACYLPWTYTLLGSPGWAETEWPWPREQQELESGGQWPASGSNWMS